MTQKRFSTILGVSGGGCELRAPIIYPPRPTPRENLSTLLKNHFAEEPCGGRREGVRVEGLSSHPPRVTPYIVQNPPSRSPAGCVGHV